MVWLRRCTHYLFIVVVAVNSTLLVINAGDYIFYTDWAWTSFVVFSIANTLMLCVGATYYLTFTGVPGTATYYALIMTVYTWLAKGAWFSRPTLPPYMTPIEPQVGKFYNSPVALGAGAGAVLSVTFTALGCKLTTWTYRWMAAWSKWD